MSLCFLIVGFQNVCLYEMADALTVCYSKDILLIKVEHPACKMWQADALLVADTVPDLRR